MNPVWKVLGAASGILAAVVGILLWAWAKKGVKPEVQPSPSGKCEMTFPSRVKLICSFGIFLSLALMAGCGFASAIARDWGAQLIIITLCVGMGWVTFTIWIEVFGSRVSFDHKALYIHSVFRGDRVIAWEEIESYEYSPTFDVYRLRLNRPPGSKVAVSLYRTGMKTFLQELKKHVVVQPEDEFEFIV